MIEIIPAILVKTEEEFLQKFHEVEPFVSWAQLDVVDGKFAPNLTWGEPSVIASLETRVKFEIDLMVSHPESAIGAWLNAVPQVERIIFHDETLGNESPKRKVFDLLTMIHEAGIEAGMSLNPKTPVEALYPFIQDGELDAVLLLGVSPGFGGQKLHENVIKKAAQLREKFPNLPIEVDGGVSEENAAELVRAGATRLAAGSFLFTHPAGVAGAIEELRIISHF